MRRKQQQEISDEMLMKNKYLTLKDKLPHPNSDPAKKQRWVVNESKIDLSVAGAQIRPRYFPFKFIWKLLFAASIQFLILHHTTSYIQAYLRLQH